MHEHDHISLPPTPPPPRGVQRGVQRGAFSPTSGATPATPTLGATPKFLIAPHQKILCHQKRRNDLFCYFKTFEVSQFGRGGS